MSQVQKPVKDGKGNWKISRTLSFRKCISHNSKNKEESGFVYLVMLGLTKLKSYQEQK